MSETKNIHLINAHSVDSVHNGLMGKFPSSDRIEEGELAVNIKSGLEHLSVKGENDIVSFILSINLELNKTVTVTLDAIKAIWESKIIILNNEMQLFKKEKLSENECQFSFYDAKIDKNHVLSLKKNEKTVSYFLSDEILHDVFSTFDGIEVIGNGTSLDDVEQKVGKLVYDSTSDEYYALSTSKEWMTLTKFYVGTDEPDCKGVLWVDDNSPLLTSRENDELRYLRQQIYQLNVKIADLYNVYEHGVVPGDSLFSAKSIMMTSDDLEAPVGGETSSEVIQLYTYNPNQIIKRVETYYNTTSEDGEPVGGSWEQTIPQLSEDEKHLWFYNKIVLENGNNLISDFKYKLCTYSETKELTDVFIHYCVTQNDNAVPEKTSFFTLERGEDIMSYLNETDKILWCYLECVYAYEKPDVVLVSGGTVPHNCAKIDTRENFSKNRTHLYNGELLFYSDQKTFAIYYDGGFFLPKGSGSGSGGGGGISVDDLYTLPLEYLIFANGNKQYNVKVTDTNKFSITQQSEDKNTINFDSHDKGKVYVSRLLTLNTVYVPKNNQPVSKSLCSHCFVEISNASDVDINLNGLYLLYTACEEDSKTNGYVWKVLPLKGIIKSNGTFLIRGEQCQKYNSSFIKVDNFDMEWYDGDNLITFEQQGAFYLVGDDNIETVISNGLKNPYNSSAIPNGYVDLFGYCFNGATVPSEGSSILNMTEDSDNVLMIRWFMMEPAQQGLKAYDKRKTSELWSYIDLTKQPNIIGDKKSIYFSDDRKLLYAPKASMDNKNFFTTRSKFKDDEPNMVFIGLGIEGTDNSPIGTSSTFHESGATRCFNWVSVGYYDEYVYYRKVGTEQWLKQYSFVESDFENEDKRQYFYKRFRWCTSDGKWVTTHKVIISGLTKGEYEFYIKRNLDEKYTSQINTFKVAHTNDVTNFSFIHTADQQGFNFQEYSVWERCCYKIADESSFEFVVNTGDATQSGNRVSEWVDYYNGRYSIRNIPEMYSIGNNDLCGYVDTKLTDGEDFTSKYNHINVRRYFTFEIDPNNIPIFNWEHTENGKTEIYEDCPIDSLYSFNYGKYHFVSLNSEVAIVSSKMYRNGHNSNYKGDASFGEQTYKKMEEWLIKDLEDYKTRKSVSDCSKCIVYCHEMPFTIVVEGFITGESERGGSKLNTLNANGLYRFSRLFYKYGIRLVLGGHKHTYSISKPIYDAPIEWNSGWTPNKAEFMNNEVNVEASRKPVIQITNASQIESKYENKLCRYQIVNKFTAPTYVMAQATGYKLVSNKELPSSNNNRTPWLLAYYPQTNAGKVNGGQYQPMYLRYDLTDNTITITAKQVLNIWLNQKFNYNSQQLEQTLSNMTLSDQNSLTLDADYNIYKSGSTREKYIIYL